MAGNAREVCGRFGFAVGVSVALLVSCAGSTFAQDVQKYEVTGFRDVRFGMTEQDVRAAVTKAFGLKPADLVTAPNQVEGTTVLTAHTATLDPGPGAASIAYIFGYSSKKLIQVNVIWGDDAAKPTDVNSIVAAGARLSRYFSSYTWRKDAAHTGIPVGDNTVVLFAGEDEKTGAVRVVADGVKYQMQQDGQKPAASSPEPKGPPKLIINYIANRDNPDIAKIEKGKF